MPECFHCGEERENMDSVEIKSEEFYICHLCSSDSSSSNCERCGGTGYIEDLGYNLDGKAVSAKSPCPKCNSPFQ